MRKVKKSGKNQHQFYLPRTTVETLHGLLHLIFRSTQGGRYSCLHLISESEQFRAAQCLIMAEPESSSKENVHSGGTSDFVMRQWREPLEQGDLPRSLTIMPKLQCLSCCFGLGQAWSEPEAGHQLPWVRGHPRQDEHLTQAELWCWGQSSSEARGQDPRDAAWG